MAASHRFVGAIRLLITVLLLWMGWRIVTLAMADLYADTDPQRALRWRSDHPHALIVRAEQLADAGNWGQARSAALAALAADPLQSRGFRVLAQDADAMGDVETAEHFFQIAASRAPGDLISQTWLFNLEMSRGDFVAAMPHLDALLRTQPQLAAALSAQLAKLATLDATQGAFVDLLNTHPPWRLPVLRQILREAADIDGLARLMRRLRQKPALEPELPKQWIDRLLQAQRFDDAYIAWVSDLDARQQARLSNVFNGDFEFPVTHAGFDWRAQSIPGVTIEFPRGGPDGKGRAMRLAFDHQRVAFHHVRQWQLLSAGQYKLIVRAQAAELRSERGLVWMVSCVPSGLELARTEPIRGQHDWRTVEVGFEVPAQGCDAQELVLMLPARIASEQQISGEVWFDEIVIRRVAANP